VRSKTMAFKMIHNYIQPNVDGIWVWTTCEATRHSCQYFTINLFHSFHKLFTVTDASLLIDPQNMSRSFRASRQG